MSGLGSTPIAAGPSGRKPTSRFRGARPIAHVRRLRNELTLLLALTSGVAPLIVSRSIACARAKARAGNRVHAVDGRFGRYGLRPEEEGRRPSISHGVNPAVFDSSARRRAVGVSIAQLHPGMKLSPTMEARRRW